MLPYVEHVRQHMAKRPLILITNDDGVNARGIKAAVDALDGLGDVWVVAPHEEISSCGHSVTLTGPIFCRKLRPKWFAIKGTPADSVFIACSDILPRLPDLVVAGINNGLNIGIDTFYSGTVSAAREASYRGIPGVAMSAGRGADLEEPARVTQVVARAVLGAGGKGNKKGGVLLNVNVPTGKPKGLKLVKLGRRVYPDHVIKRKSPRGRDYYWINGGPADVDPGPGTDGRALAVGFVSVTPLGTDQTDHGALKSAAGRFMKEMEKEWARR